jgi:hypothetical protein
MGNISVFRQFQPFFKALEITGCISEVSRSQHDGTLETRCDGPAGGAEPQATDQIPKAIDIDMII